MGTRDLLLYWIEERYEILLKKKNGVGKPWSADPVFQRTYFCNVRREDDKVTSFIRDMYSPHVDHDLFEYNIVLARFLNWPPTLRHIGYQETHDPVRLNNQLRELATKGKVWGNAYVITTHGMPMPKVDYLTNDVLCAVFDAVDRLRAARAIPAAGATLNVLEGVAGIGSFLAGQIIADLKNTPRHPLQKMEDWWTFVVPGPGSLRGASWFWTGAANELNIREFSPVFQIIRNHVDRNWPKSVPPICNQDLQNCLCEFDKYMRVKTGTGRSKRNYPGV